MKRRDFIASAALALWGTEALAAKKESTKNKSSSKPAKKPAAKPAKKSNTSTRTPSVTNQSADRSIVDRPPTGSSAARLPPVRAVAPPDEWHHFEITTRIQWPDIPRNTQVWLPLPLNQDTLFQRTIDYTWTGNQERASLRRLPDGILEAFTATWGNGPADLALSTRVSTADRIFDITKRTHAPERDDILRQALQASRLVPNDGLAQQLGQQIVGRIKDPVAQAKAIYDWVIDNTNYDPSLPGCGTGNIHQQLNTGRYGGRSADINGLFVSICRSIGIPARCVYGIRVGPSRLSRSLGINQQDASRSHHVRAEFYVPGYSWIPVDPSDARRVIAMEALSERDSKWSALRKVLFGVWEMNWIAYNLGTDLQLPGSHQRQPFFIQPQFEQADHSYAQPASTVFPYQITARRVEL